MSRFVQNAGKLKGSSGLNIFPAVCMKGISREAGEEKVPFSLVIQGEAKI